MICSMVDRVWRTAAVALVAGVTLLQPGETSAAQVAVRHTEGGVHGFLALHTLAGEPLADGDLIQVARGDRVTSQLVFHFKDGSVHDETAVFSQRGNFLLLNYHLVQKGHAFQHPIEVSIDGSTGQVIVRSTDEDGKEKVPTERLDLPRDVANGNTPGDVTEMEMPIGTLPKCCSSLRTVPLSVWLIKEGVFACKIV